MCWVVYRGLNDGLDKQQAVKSTQILLTPSEPCWRVIQVPDGRQFRAYVTTVQVVQSGSRHGVICESSSVHELNELDEVKRQLNRRCRERPILHHDWPEPPMEMQDLPDFDATAGNLLQDYRD